MKGTTAALLVRRIPLHHFLRVRLDLPGVEEKPGVESHLLRQGEQRGQRPATSDGTKDAPTGIEQRQGLAQEKKMQLQEIPSHCGRNISP